MQKKIGNQNTINNQITQTIMKKSIFWILRLIPAIIMLQTLFYKFSGAPESIYIFTQMGIEPYGRIGSGIVELVASVLLLLPNKSVFGAFLGAGTMLGAILSHIFILGINVNNDGGFLFSLALITFVACSLILFLERNNILSYIQKFIKK